MGWYWPTANYALFDPAFIPRPYSITVVCNHPHIRSDLAIRPSQSVANCPGSLRDAEVAGSNPAVPTKETTGQGHPPGWPSGLGADSIARPSRASGEPAAGISPFAAEESFAEGVGGCPVGFGGGLGIDGQGEAGVRSGSRSGEGQGPLAQMTTGDELAPGAVTRIRVSNRVVIPSTGPPAPSGSLSSWACCQEAPSGDAHIAPLAG